MYMCLTYTFIWYNRVFGTSQSVLCGIYIILFFLRAALKDLGEPQNKRWPSFNSVTSE